MIKMRNKLAWKWKRMPVLAGLAIAVTILFCLVGSVEADDMGEILSAETRVGSIAYAGQTDNYTFYGVVNQTVIIQMSTQSDSLDPQIRLYAPNGSEEANASGEVSAGVFTPALIRNHPLQQTGIYTIVAMDTKGNDIGNYSLSLLLIPGPTTSSQDPDGGDIASAETKTGTINPYADTDAWIFYGAVNQTVIIQMSTQSDSLDPQIRLYAPNGSEEANASGEVSSMYAPALIRNHPLQQTGIYTIVAMDTKGNDIGNYSLSLLLILCGDINGDGNVDFLGDVIGVARHYMYGDPINCAWCADVDCDGDIDFLGDAIKIARHYMYGEALTCCSS
jgi:hypothetical protein